jgi:hypothetical protein
MLSRSARRWLAVVAILQLLTLIAFLYAVHRADMAMDKTGLGDVAASQRWSAVAGVAFYSYALCWAVGAALTAVAWLAGRRKAGTRAALHTGRVAVYALLLPPAAFLLAAALYLALG